METILYEPHKCLGMCNNMREVLGSVRLFLWLFYGGQSASTFVFHELWLTDVFLFFLRTVAEQYVPYFTNDPPYTHSRTYKSCTAGKCQPHDMCHGHCHYQLKINMLSHFFPSFSICHYFVKKQIDLLIFFCKPIHNGNNLSGKKVANIQKN